MFTYVFTQLAMSSSVILCFVLFLGFVVHMKYISFVFISLLSSREQAFFSGSRARLSINLMSTCPNTSLRVPWAPDSPVMPPSKQRTLRLKSSSWIPKIGFKIVRFAPHLLRQWVLQDVANLFCLTSSPRLDLKMSHDMRVSIGVHTSSRRTLFRST